MADEKPQKKITVLVVDDSRVVRVAASRMFGEDFEVLLAVDGADALGIIENNPEIQVVFSDLAMPEMDGYELLESVRQHTDESIRSLPLIIATGAGNPEPAKHKAFSLGATDFITKPFNGMDLKARARSYAQLRQANKTLKEQVTIDAMTGLLNPKGFKMQLEKDIAFAGRHDANMTLMTIEIDHYKDLFIRIGRQSTEQLIKKVSHVLEETFRKEDSIARIGLARFIVSLPLAHASNAIDLANRLCHTIESFKVKLDGKRIKITVSAGVVSVSPDVDVEVDMLVNMANKALDIAADRGASQMYELSLEDYLEYLRDIERKSMSIDKLLDDIEAGEQKAVGLKLESAMIRLQPLFAMFSDEQVKLLVASRDKKVSNVVFFDNSSGK